MNWLTDTWWSLFYWRWCDTYRTYWRLRKIYRTKQKGFVCDLKVDKQDGIFPSSIKVDRIRLPLESGAEGIYCLYHIDGFYHRHIAEGVKYDLIGADGIKYIRSCLYREYLQLYGRIL